MELIRKSVSPRRRGVPRAVHVLPDRMGGVTTFVRNLLHQDEPDRRHETEGTPPEPLRHDVVLTRERQETHHPCAVDFCAESVWRLDYASGLDNVFSVLRLLRRALPDRPGPLVSNDSLELAMAGAFALPQTVFHIVHVDHPWAYDLIRRHEPVIDVLIATTRSIRDRLQRLLPERGEDIFFRPYPIHLPPRVRTAASGPLRLIYFGRLEQHQKGVLDLPEIDRELCRRGVEARWTVIGEGPDAHALREAWVGGNPVHWAGALAPEQVLEALPEHDVMVLPTRFEGQGIAVIEAMGAGVVPVVNRVPGGVEEIVTDGRNGFLVPVGAVGETAETIGALSRDRERLETLSRAALASAAEGFDADRNRAAYHELFARFRELKRAAPSASRRLMRRRLAGSRLDRPWLPNFLVRALRNDPQERP